MVLFYIFRLLLSRSSIIVFVQSTFVMFYRVYPLGFHVLAFALFCSWGFINQLVIVKKIVRSCSITWHHMASRTTSRHVTVIMILFSDLDSYSYVVQSIRFVSIPARHSSFRGVNEILFWTWSVWLASAPWPQHNFSTPISGQTAYPYLRQIHSAILILPSSKAWHDPIFCRLTVRIVQVHTLCTTHCLWMSRT